MKKKDNRHKLVLLVKLSAVKMVFDRKTFINETTRPKQEVNMTQAKNL